MRTLLLVSCGISAVAGEDTFPLSNADTPAAYDAALKWGADAAWKITGTDGASDDINAVEITGVKCKAAATILGKTLTDGGDAIAIEENKKPSEVKGFDMTKTANWALLLAKAECSCAFEKSKLQALSDTAGDNLLSTKAHIKAFTPCAAHGDDELTSDNCKDATGGLLNTFSKEDKKCVACTKADAAVLSPLCPAATPVCEAGKQTCAAGTADGTKADAAGCLVWSANGVVDGDGNDKCKCKDGTTAATFKTGLTKDTNCVEAAKDAAAHTHEATVKGELTTNDDAAADAAAVKAALDTELAKKEIYADKIKDITKVTADSTVAAKAARGRQLGAKTWTYSSKLTFTFADADKLATAKTAVTGMSNDDFKTIMTAAIAAAGDGALKGATATVTEVTAAAASSSTAAGATSATKAAGSSSSAMGQSGLVALFLMAGAATFF